MSSGFSMLMAGMPVRGADAHRVGTVKQVQPAEVLVHRVLQPSVHVPLEAIRAVTANEVVLGLTADELDELYWVHAGEDLTVDLRGIYAYDYRTP